MSGALYRGKRLDGMGWASGYLTISPSGANYIHGRICDGDSPKRVEPATVGQYTGMSCENGMLFEGDIVEFFGMRGKIVQECGAFGIGCSKLIDYDLLESQIPYNNGAYFCHNDNFISLWELWWNYEQDDNPLFEVRKIGNVHDNPELLREA